MTRFRFAIVILAATFALAAGAACPGGAANVKCGDVGCDMEKIADGVRCTMKAKGDMDVAALRECVRACAAKHAMEGVTVSFEDIDGGIVVTKTGNSPDVIEALYAKAANCGKDGCGFCNDAGCKGCCGKKCDKKEPCCKKHGRQAV